MTLRAALAAIFLLSSAIGCSSGSSPPAVVLPAFGNVSDAPAPIQAAAQAVVRIQTAGERATGSFVSSTGLLLTNNHVLGAEICPVEGCYAQIAFNYQKGTPFQSPQTFFVVPKALDVGLDMAVVQVYASEGGAPLATPSFLTLESRDPASLLGTHVHVVGHPDGHLKKWSQGEVIDSNGSWIWFSAYSLPGNSGSPVLDDAGRMVGILHRGPSAQDLVNATGVSEYAIGSASSALLASIANAPDNGLLRSINASTTADDVVQHHTVYLNARAPNAVVAGATTPVVSLLGSACDAALAQPAYDSPDAMAIAFEPCTAAQLWIECRTEYVSSSHVCPSDTDAWSARYQGVFARWVSLNGEVTPYNVSFALAALSSSKAQGQIVGGQGLQQGLGQAPSWPLDFTVSTYLAAFDLLSYMGTNLLGFTTGYAKYPDYGLFGAEIANTAVWLYDDSAMNRGDVTSLLQNLEGDGNVDLGAKLFVEEDLYEFGVL